MRLLSTPDAHESGFIEQAAKLRTPRADTNVQSLEPESAESAGLMLDQSFGSADSAGYAGYREKVIIEEGGHTHNGHGEKKCVCVDTIEGDNSSQSSISSISSTDTGFLPESTPPYPADSASTGHNGTAPGPRSRGKPREGWIFPERNGRPQT